MKPPPNQKSMAAFPHATADIPVVRSRGSVKPVATP